MEESERGHVTGLRAPALDERSGIRVCHSASEQGFQIILGTTQALKPECSLGLHYDPQSWLPVAQGSHGDNTTETHSLLSSSSRNKAIRKRPHIPPLPR